MTIVDTPRAYVDECNVELKQRCISSFVLPLGVTYIAAFYLVYVQSRA